MKKLVSRLALIALAATLFGLAGSSPANAGSYVFQATCIGVGNPTEPMKAVIDPNTFDLWGNECETYVPYPWVGETIKPFGVRAGSRWTKVEWLKRNDRGWVGYDLGSGAKFTKVNHLEYYNDNRSNLWSALRIQGGTHNYPLVGLTPNSGASGTISNVDIPAAGQGPRLQSVLECNAANCHLSEEGWAMIIGRPRLTIEDFTAPVAAFNGGTLFSGTSVSGTRTVVPLALDGNSGVAGIWGFVNGQLAFSRSASCNTAFLQPCPSPFTPGGVSLNTAQAPFVEGTNTIMMCAYDYAQTGTANGFCTDPLPILVDN